MVRRVLTDLSDRDPAGEAKSVMRANYIAQRGWHFRFGKASFFVTSFAPCYPNSSSRYAFNTSRAFVLLQPERSFLRHQLPPDTPDTNWEAPETIRDKTRSAFKTAGRPYLIPNSTRYAVAPHIVKPLHDTADAPVVHWWEELEGLETEAGEGSSQTSEDAHSDLALSSAEEEEEETKK